MGYGDELMATGMARGAQQRSRKIAFGEYQGPGLVNRIIWSHLSREIFQGNPNIAPPETAHGDGLEWIRHYRGHRLYNTLDPVARRWVWNMQFRAIPGEMFFSAEELKYGESFGRDFVVIEPNVPAHKSIALNKQWPPDRFRQLAARLRADGYDVRQFSYGAPTWLNDAKPIPTPTFRHALAVLRNARLIVTGEGGLHHGAAAVECPAVVIFGGFIPPQVTGYDDHVNLAYGEACGALDNCDHCRRAMEAITLQQVLDSAHQLLERKEMVA